MNKHDLKRNEYMLTGSFKRKGYDWWWHSFTAINENTGLEKSFFIEFFLINPGLKEDQPVFGQLPENKKNKKRPSYVMVKVGTWGNKHIQLHKFFSWNDVKVNKKAPYSVSTPDAFVSETETYGTIEVNDSINHPEWMCNDGKISWYLKINKKVAFNVGYGASSFFRAIKAFEMYWHAEGMKTEYEGWVDIDGQRYIVKPDTCYGYADKNWGRGFTSPWVWLSSCNITSNITGKKLDNTVFDIGGGKPKIYFLPLKRKLLGAINYEGIDYEFNFSKFWTGSKTEFESSETKDEIIWHVKQDTRKACMITDITCKKKDMLLVNYEAPDGSKRHNRLWNGGNGQGRVQLFKKEKGKLILIDDVNVKNVGCEYGEYDK